MKQIKCPYDNSNLAPAGPGNMGRDSVFRCFVCDRRFVIPSKWIPMIEEKENESTTNGEPSFD